MSYADPAEAGFDAARLEAARTTWEGIPSSAFLVVSNGAVVAAWGDVDRRFMCHSVRKSFMSALYGIYWDRGEIELNKTLVDLGIDDEDDALLESEKQARILDLLKARSGIFHPAAYAGRTDSQPRGSQGPGRYFAYNNWDFNTLVTIFEQETGAKVFEAFEEFFSEPLEMEDWRLSDGYYHYERDKSMHPAYPFRLSARDAARFGLVYARGGLWGETRILSRDWVQRSMAMYSIDTEQIGYGLLWWVFREPRFKQYGMAAALGVGNQMIAVLPDIDLVIVNRANTYEGQRTPMPELLDLIEEVLEARVGEPKADTDLAPLVVPAADPRLKPVPDEQLAKFVGEWPYPPAPLGMPPVTTVSCTIDDGALVAYSDVSGTFREYLQPDGSFIEEDSLERYIQIPDEEGSFAGIADGDAISRAVIAAAVADDMAKAESFLDLTEGESGVRIEVARATIDLLNGREKKAKKALEMLAETSDPRRVEGSINFVGYSLLQAERLKPALEVFEINTELFPESFNAWDSFGEVLMMLGKDAKAIASYEKSLELNAENTNAEEMIARIKGGGEKND
jgi:CubicO group peptidase (beta-lactamase class C family)/predicted negative regulator of RcsB-dependent stress response